jgi:hypothetical protein
VIVDTFAYFTGAIAVALSAPSRMPASMPLAIRHELAQDCQFSGISASNDYPISMINHDYSMLTGRTSR